MDINLSQPSHKKASVASRHIQSLNLKINQKLDVKVINSTFEKQTVTLQIAQSKATFQVKSNIPFDVSSGQKLKILVSKTSPEAEFKVISADSAKLADLKQLTLKQIEVPRGSLKPLQNKVVLQTAKEAIINAKIISIAGDKVLLKALDSKLGKGQSLTNMATQSSLIQLSKNQLTTTSQQGDTLQLKVSKQAGEQIFKVLDVNPVKLIKGQVIPATVIKISNKQLEIMLTTQSKGITLKLNQLFNSVLKTAGKQAEAIQVSNFQVFKKGQQINLEVLKTGGKPEFKLVDKNYTSSQLIHDSFKQNLPNQQQPSVLQNQIIQQLSHLNKSANIPDTLKQLAREILDHLQHKPFQSSSQLKQAMSNSGLFLEAKLARNDEQSKLAIHPDYKNKLLKFNHALKHSISLEKNLTLNEVNLLKELQQKSENSLAKVILNQLSSLPKEEASKQMWVVDLAFINKEVAESVEISINQEQKKLEENDRQNWAVTITVSPPGMGTITCKVSCFDKIINTTFWSDTEEVVTKINRNLDYLKSQFESAGIDSGHLSAQIGVAPTENYRKINREDAPLVNQKV